MHKKGGDRSVWRNDAVSCQAHVLLVLDERNVSVELLCNDTDWGK